MTGSLVSDRALHDLRAILACALAFTGCAKGPAAGETDVDKLPRLALVEELRIGSRDNPDTGFAAIGGVDVDRDGRVYVFESQRVHIRVYDPAGRLLRTIGRRGSGPGEFERFAAFGVVGDTLWAYESTRRRMALFNRAGEVLSANRIEGVRVELQSPGSIGVVLPRFMRADGLFVGDMNLFTGGSSEGPWPVKPTDTVNVPRVIFAANGAVVDTAGWDKRPPPPASERSEWVEVGGTRYIVPRPPRAESRTLAVEDGRIMIDVPPPAPGEPGLFTVTRVGMAGDTVYHRRFQYVPSPYTKALLDSVVWRSVRVPGGGIPIIDGIAVPRPTRPDSMAAFDAIRSRIAFPDYQSPIQYFNIQDDGSVWLRREEDGRAPARWLILAPDGSARGQLELPARHRVAWSGGDILWIVEPDEMDVPWLVRYRVSPGAGSR